MMKLNMIQMKKVFLPVALLAGLAGSTGVRAEVPAGGSSIPGSNVAVGLSGEVVKGTCSVIVESGQNLYFGRFLNNEAGSLGEKKTLFTIKGCLGQKVSLTVNSLDFEIEDPFTGVNRYYSYMTSPQCFHGASPVLSCPLIYSLTLEEPGKSTRLPLDEEVVSILPSSDSYPISIKVAIKSNPDDFPSDLNTPGHNKGAYTYNFVYD
ncbi:hypothetical protein HF234_003743 [Salmonella enterica]|nr:hypothetical protein [Salmonella enterica]